MPPDFRDAGRSFSCLQRIRSLLIPEVCEFKRPETICSKVVSDTDSGVYTMVAISAGSQQPPSDGSEDNRQRTEEQNLADVTRWCC